MKGYLLAMDTSTATISIALLQDGVMIAEEAAVADRNHSKHLLPLVQTMLAKQDLKIRDLSAIGVGQGPGSYTGVRIGITAAKTFAWAQQIPVYAISSLETLALGGYRHYTESQSSSTGLVSLNFDTSGSAFGYGACSIDGCEPIEPSTKWIIPLMNARRGQAYTALYAAGKGESWSTMVPDKIRLMSAWCEELQAMLNVQSKQNESSSPQPQEIIFVGETEGFEEQISALAEVWNGKVTTWMHHMRGRDLGELAYKRWHAGEPSDNVHTLVPNYTQITEAENNLRKSQKERG